MQWVVMVHQKKLLMVLIHNHKSNKKNFFKIFGDKDEIEKYLQ